MSLYLHFIETLHLLKISMKNKKRLNLNFFKFSTLPEDDICKGSTEFCNYGIMHQSGYLISSLFSLSGYSNQLSSRFGEVA